MSAVPLLISLFSVVKVEESALKSVLTSEGVKKIPPLCQKGVDVHRWSPDASVTVGWLTMVKTVLYLAVLVAAPAHQLTTTMHTDASSKTTAANVRLHAPRFLFWREQGIRRCGTLKERDP